MDNKKTVYTSDVIILSQKGDVVGAQSEERLKLLYEFFYNFESEHTRKSYKTDIEQFFQYLRMTFRDVQILNEVTRFHMVAYRNFLGDKEMAPKTINRKLSSVSSYFDFLMEKGLVDINPSNGLKRPKQEVQTPTQDLSDEQVQNLIDLVHKEGTPLHRAVVTLLFATGIRKSELINLKREDFTAIGEHKVINIRAKGGKQLTKVVPEICVETIASYLAWMEAQGRPVGAEDILFQPTRNPKDPQLLNKKLRPKAIDYIVKSYAKKAGIFHKISPHSARATYIGSALEAGVPIWKVAQDVGHSSIKTTEEYNKRRGSLDESPAHSLGYLKNKKSA